MQTSPTTYPPGTVRMRPMLDALARNWGLILLRGIIAIIFGVLTFVWPGITLISLVLLAIFGLVMLYMLPTIKFECSSVKLNFKTVLKNKKLLYLDFSILVQHLLLTSTFFVVPLLLEHNMHMLWQFYLLIVGLSFVLVLPIIIFIEKTGQVNLAVVIAIILLLISQILLLLLHFTLFGIGIALFLYFVAFNFLEANLPALVSKSAPKQNRGAAMGIYSSFQFLGIFCGGIIAGLVYNFFGNLGVFVINIIFILGWLVLSNKWL